MITVSTCSVWNKKRVGRAWTDIFTSKNVLQVSCGPFHCAAVSADGALFTWGEGFGGKLGHGDQGSRGEPTLVQALCGRQVRHYCAV